MIRTLLIAALLCGCTLPDSTSTLSGPLGRPRPVPCRYGPCPPPLPVPQPHEVVFNPALATGPMGGWRVDFIVGERDPKTLQWTVTLETQSSSRWNDHTWIEANKRHSNGTFFVPFYRYRSGYCLIDTLAIAAQGGVSASFTLDPSGLRSGDTFLYEHWAGYSMRLEVSTQSGEKVFDSTVRWIEGGPQPAWGQEGVVMSCA